MLGSKQRYFTRLLSPMRGSSRASGAGPARVSGGERRSESAPRRPQLRSALCPVVCSAKALGADCSLFVLSMLEGWPSGLRHRS
jgi:hypothetical protein